MQIIPFIRKTDLSARTVEAPTIKDEGLLTTKQQNILDYSVKTVATGSGTVVPLHRNPKTNSCQSKGNTMDEQEDIFAGMPLPSDEEMQLELDFQYEQALFKEELDNLVAGYATDAT